MWGIACACWEQSKTVVPAVSYHHLACDGLACTLFVVPQVMFLVMFTYLQACGGMIVFFAAIITKASFVNLVAFAIVMVSVVMTSVLSINRFVMTFFGPNAALWGQVLFYPLPWLHFLKVCSVGQ